MFVHTSNNMERLADLCADVYAHNSPVPFTPEIIIVQSRGMEHWLSMQLAKRFGVWTNCSFPFPNAFVNDIFGNKHGERSPFDPPALALRIMRILPQLIDISGFEELRTYCAQNNDDDLRLYQLSTIIADIFDQYTVYRPSLLLAWENSHDPSWQAQLWRSLTRDTNAMHRSRIHSELLLRLAKESFQLPFHGNRLSVFGISSLPPFYIDLFTGLSRHIDVHLFVLNPCSQFWTDIKSEKEMAGIALHKQDTFDIDNELHFDTGNPLLASLGTCGKHFFSLLSDRGCEETFHEVDMSEDTMLHTVQSDIAGLKNRGHDTDAPKRYIDISDSSIRLHSCHSPMREAEVLHDTLLHFFDTMPNLRPNDIVVMTPDMETYAPYIRAVFETEGKIPFSIADQHHNANDAPTEAFFTILDICASRFTATGVLSLLDFSCVRRAFNIDESDIDTIRHVVRETGIRWGIDADNRARVMTHATKGNTWQSGIDAICAGYAMQSDGTALFNGIFPATCFNMSQTECLGSFLDFAKHLFTFAQSLADKQKPQFWETLFKQIAHRMIAPDSDEASSFTLLRTAIHTCLKTAHDASLTMDISAAVAIAQLRQNTQSYSSTSGYLSGQVTCCAMMPMRSIPFRIVCLIGMNDRVFPRKTRRMSWDMIGTFPQKGDRSLDKEDRYVFLEAILSARDALHISYTGNSIRDNTTQSPSIVVCELVDYIRQAFTVHNDDKSFPAENAITIQHRLQAFSPDYFTAHSRISSYSTQNFSAAQKNLLRKNNRRPFFSSALADTQSATCTISLVDLCAFYSNPAQYICKIKLGISLDNSDYEIPDSEPFLPTGLDAYTLVQDMCTSVLSGCDSDSIHRILSARAVLPHGTVGDCYFNNLMADISSFVKKLPSRETIRNVPFSLTVNGTIIEGTIDSVIDNKIIGFRFADVKAKDYLESWIRLCVLAAVTSQNVSAKIFAKDATITLRSPENPMATMASLIELYKRGMQMPLPFFPKTSSAYVQSLCKNVKSHEESLAKCRLIWEGSQFVQGENNNPYYSLCFDNCDPLDRAFCVVSRSVFEPIFTAMEKTE